MDNQDITVDIAQNDLRGARPSQPDLAGDGDGPAPADADARGLGGSHLAPTSRRALVGNPRRVRL